MLVRAFDEKLYIAASVKDRQSIYLRGLKPAENFYTLPNMLVVPALIASQTKEAAIRLARQKYGEDFYDIYELNPNGFTGASLEDNCVYGQLKADDFMDENQASDKLPTLSEVHIDAQAGSPALLGLVKRGGAESAYHIPGKMLDAEGMLQKTFKGDLYIPISYLHAYTIGSNFLSDSRIRFLRCSETEEGGMEYGNKYFGRNNFLLYKINVDASPGISWYENYLFNQQNTAAKLKLPPENMTDISKLSDSARELVLYRMVDLDAKIDKKQWTQIFDPAKKLPGMDTSESMRSIAAEKELQNVAELYHPILNPPSFVENYIKEEISAYEKKTGTKTGLTPDSKIIISYHILPPVGISGSHPISENANTVIYSLIDIVTGQYRRDLNNRYGSTKYAIKSFEHKKLIEDLTKNDLQRNMQAQLLRYFDSASHIEGMKKYYIDMMRLRCLQYLAAPEINPLLKLAVMDFMEGKCGAKEVAFHDINVNGAFFIPAGNGGVLFSVNDPIFFEAPEKNIDIYVSSGYKKITIPGLPETSKFHNWILNKIHFYERDKYKNNRTAFSNEIKYVENDGEFSFSIPQISQLPFAFSTPKNLDTLLSRMVENEKDRLSSDINYLMFSTEEQRTQQGMEAATAILEKAAMFAAFTIPGASSSAAWARLMVPLTLDSAFVSVSLIKASQADRADHADDCKREALMAGALGILGAVFGVRVEAGLLKQGISANKALKFFRRNRSGQNNQQNWFKPPTRLKDGRIGYPLSPHGTPKLALEPVPVPAKMLPGVDVTMPLDGVEIIKDKNIMKYKVKDKNGDTRFIKYDSNQGAWRPVYIDGSISRDFAWREKSPNHVQWEFGGEKDFLNAKKNGFPASTHVELVHFGNIPKVPSHAKPIPKKIHSVWIGGDIQDHLVKNIINNAKKSSGYEYALYVDANNENIFNAIKSKINNEVSNLKVVDLKTLDLYKDFIGDGKLSSLYATFRNGNTKNLPALSDAVRYKLLEKNGGIYLDTDDVIVNSVENINLKAMNNDILLNRLIKHDGANFIGFGNGNIACLPNNNMIKEVINEMMVRFNNNKDYLIKNRPYSNLFAKREELVEFRKYQKTIFHVTGPDLLTDVIRGKNTASGMMINLEMAVETKNIALPSDFEKAKINAENYYFPFKDRFKVKIGSEHAMQRTR